MPPPNEDYPRVVETHKKNIDFHVVLRYNLELLEREVHAFSSWIYKNNLTVQLNYSYQKGNHIRDLKVK